MSHPSAHRVLISAHRCGRRDDRSLDNKVAGVHEAARLGADFVEFDVQRCADGTYVCFHDDTVRTRDGHRLQIAELTAAEAVSHLPGLETLSDLLTAVADTGLRAHVDLKFVSPSPAYATWEQTWEVECAEVCATAVGAENMILTTLEDRSVAALRKWVVARGHSTLIGLSLGKPTSGRGLLATLRMRFTELFPTSRMQACDATLLVANHVLAQVSLLRWAHRRRMPVLVWTVDHSILTNRMLRDSRVWLLTTNWPSRALAARSWAAPVVGE